MKENYSTEKSDNDIIAAYNKPTGESASPEAEARVEESEPENTPDEKSESVALKKKKRGIDRHLYPCPHCGEQVLDHFTVCPKCGGELTPRGYHVDEEKRKKIVRVFQIAGAVVSVGLVVLLAILLNR